MPAATPDGTPALPTEQAWWRKRFPPDSVHRGRRPVPADTKIDLARLDPSRICGSFDGGVADPSGSVYLWGWAYDPRTDTPVLSVVLLDNGEPLLPPISITRDRPDVARFKGNPELLRTGWSVWVPFGRLAEGRHSFEALAVLDDGSLGRLGGGADIEVRRR